VPRLGSLRCAAPNVGYGERMRNLTGLLVGSVILAFAVIATRASFFKIKN